MIDHDLWCSTCKHRDGWRTGAKPCSDCLEHDDLIPPLYHAAGDTAKDDAEKLRLSLVPPELVEAVAEVREYGNRKYGDPDNWKTVEADRYWDAILRHVLAAWNDWQSLDHESGLPHLWHIACNCAFLCAMMKREMGVGEDA